MVREEASKPYLWAALAREHGVWKVQGRGMTDGLATARRDGRSAAWAVVPFTVDPRIPERVHHEWRTRVAS